MGGPYNNYEIRFSPIIKRILIYFQEETACILIIFTRNQALRAWFQNTRCGLIQNRNQNHLICAVVFHFVFDFLLRPNENYSIFIGQQGFFKILMITLISRKIRGVYRNMRNTVPQSTRFSQIYFLGYLHTQVYVYSRLLFRQLYLDFMIAYIKLIVLL